MMKRLLISCIAVVVLTSVLAPKGRAIAPFYKEFRGEYSEENDNEEFVKAVKSAKCYVCHIGKKKKNHNDYGAELAKLLDKKTDKKDKEKIRKALKTVAGLPSKPKEEKSPTYGQLIAKGKLPGGKPQKEDPEAEDKEENSEVAAGS